MFAADMTGSADVMASPPTRQRVTENENERVLPCLLYGIAMMLLKCDFQSIVDFK
jgi:hypothetical protein